MSPPGREVNGRVRGEELRPFVAAGCKAEQIRATAATLRRPLRTNNTPGVDARLPAMHVTRCHSTCGGCVHRQEICISGGPVVG